MQNSQQNIFLLMKVKLYYYQQAVFDRKQNFIKFY